MPKVYNKHHKNAPQGAVYIGRGSPWGNSFVIGKDGTREECIELFQEKVDNDPEFRERVKKELARKDLVCYCAPLMCHGDILLRIANEQEDK